MVLLILGMLVCLVLAAVVVALVAIPARREGRDVLTPRGEEVVSAVRSRTGSALNKTGTAAGSATSRRDGTGRGKETEAKESPEGSSDEVGTEAASKADPDGQVGRAG